MKAAVLVAADNNGLGNLKERFVAVNRERLRRTREIMRPRQRDFLELLPLLFHANDPILPGFVSTDTPCGIVGYTPGEKSIVAAKKLAGKFELSKKPLRRFGIHGVFIMGSAGSVAFSDKSDFDIWLCYNPGMGEAELDCLARKAESIEKWAAGLNLEVHFFLMNAERFKNGELQTLSDESSGSAQHHLLLDEFYRTGLWLAGRYPFWWLVSPEQESRYDQVVAKMRAENPSLDGECIDFGGLAHIPANEFFGAALWQVYKGIDSPYKSALKISLIESYASAYPDIELLCVSYKHLVHAGTTDIDALDPYVMLLDKLEHFYGENTKTEQINLIRRCFYLKTNIHLSDHNRKSADWRHELVGRLVKAWGWSDWEFEFLDARANWKINRVLDERQALVETLVGSYLFLSDFARKHARTLMIREDDLNLLGRKLYAAFERKAGKIDIVNRGIAPDISESQITIIQTQGEDQEKWLLFIGKVEPQNANSRTALKQGRGLVELIAWCYFNKIMDAGTRIVLHTPGSDVTPMELKAIREHLQKLFPESLLNGATDEDLLAPPRVISSSLFINVGIVPKSMRTRLDKQLVSGKTDIFKFGPGRENLAVSFDQIVVTSWREVYAFRYTGFNGLLECLCNYLQWEPIAERRPPPALSMYSFSSHFGHVITTQVRRLYQDISEAYYHADALPETRYVIQAEKTYYALTYELGRLRPERADRLGRLLHILERPNLIFSPVFVDQHTLKNTALPLMFRVNKPGIVQAFYQRQEREINLYVIDEHGSMYYQRIRHEDTASVIHHYFLFFKSILHRQHYIIRAGDALAPVVSNDIEFYEVIKEHRYHYLRRLDLDYPKREFNYFNVQVIGNVDSGKAVFNIFCNEREFTSLEYGDRLFVAVAKHISEQRQSGARYPIYITDLDLAPVLLGLESQNRIQTIHFLNYKRRIENRLTQALNEL